MCVVGTQEKHLTEELLMSTHNIFSSRSKKNVSFRARKSRLDKKWILILVCGSDLIIPGLATNGTAKI